MASSLASVNTDQVLRGLECTICQEYFQEPRMLPCGHTLCLKPCLEEISAAKSRFRCAECRTEHDVPTGGVHNFPKNVAISRQIIPERRTDGRAVSTLKSCPICGEEEDLLKCGHCKMFVCYVCVTKHIPKFKEKIEKQARDIKDEAGNSTELCMSTEKATHLRLNQEAESAVAEIQAAARQAVQMVEERAEQLKAQVKVLHKQQLEEASKASEKVRDVWSAVTDICETILVDIFDENVTFSPAKLSKIGEKMESAHKRAKDLKLDSIAPERKIEVDVDSAVLENAAKHFTAVKTISLTRAVADTDISDKLKNSLTISPKETVVKPVVSKIDLIDKDISKVMMQIGTRGTNIGQVSRPWSVALDANSGDVFVVDTGNHRIQKFDSTGRLSLCFGSKGSGPNQFASPFGLVVTKQKQLVVSDELNHSIKVYNIHGSLQRTIGKLGSGPGQFDHPCGLTLDHSGNIHVCDGSNNRIQVLNPDGKYTRQYKAQKCTYPMYISMSPSGLISVSDGRNCVLLDMQGQQLIHHFRAANNVSGLRMHGNDLIIVSHASAHTVCVYNLNGDLMKSFDLSKTSQSYNFREPRGLTMDKHGHLYVACSDAILKF